jgi:hypothetical protein
VRLSRAIEVKQKIRDG